ncbi:unnamed protein product [Hymenolepis diminuta]|uniref:Uncharacterized protein n=1 Tax=Hymenolepis diminuta TaxID=6216 RepID=A0A564Z739_HYMDI|nr:unnamed protein product [Hymenolepis diminuta]
MIITPEREYDTEQFHRGNFKEILPIPDASNPKWGEKKQCLSKQTPAIHKRRARRKSNT